MRKISATTHCILKGKGIEKFGIILMSSRYLYNFTLNCVTERFGEEIKLLFRVNNQRIMSLPIFLDALLSVEKTNPDIYRHCHCRAIL